MALVWWKKKENFITYIERNEYLARTDLYGRKTKEGWEYGIIWWFDSRPHLMKTIKNGKATKV